MDHFVDYGRYPSMQEVQTKAPEVYAKFVRYMALRDTVRELTDALSSSRLGASAKKPDGESEEGRRSPP